MTPPQGVRIDGHLFHRIALSAKVTVNPIQRFMLRVFGSGWSRQQQCNASVPFGYQLEALICAQPLILKPAHERKKLTRGGAWRRHVWCNHPGERIQGGSFPFHEVFPGRVSLVECFSA